MKLTKRFPQVMVLAALAAFNCMSTAVAARQVQVVTTLPDYASIAELIGGSRVKVTSIAKGYQDAHFVRAKPSFARLLAGADLFITTGLDLELWAPTLIDKSRNSKIRENAVGYVSAAHGLHLLQIPKSANRSAGDIHVYGNPHIHTDPLNGVLIARNILIGLKKVDRDGAADYQQGYETFRDEIYRRLYGQQLVDLVGGEQLAQLTRNHQLDAFLDGNQFDGEPLRSRLEGWFKDAACVQDKEIVAYHLNWIYFVDRFGLRVVDYVEAKPGIPPSARHVVDLIDKVTERKVRALLAANYYEESAPRKVEESTGMKALIVPLSVGGTPEAATYFDLFDIWIRELRSAFPDCRPAGSKETTPGTASGAGAR